MPVTDHSFGEEMVLLHRSASDIADARGQEEKEMWIGSGSSFV